MTPTFHHSLLAAILLCGSSSASENWPQFRGADARGVSTNTNLPDK